MANVTAGGISAAANIYDQSPEENNELLHLHADVEPDGASALLSIHTTDGQLDLSITIEQMSSTVAEMREAGSVMMSRQLKAPDKGRSAFEAMMRNAPLAATVTLTHCRVTGDVVIVYRFPDRMPFSVRVAHDQFFAARAAFSSELQRSSN